MASVVDLLPTVLYNPGVTIFDGSPINNRCIMISDEIIIEISCGNKHSLIVCQSGKVFGLGDNSKQQCGLGRRVKTNCGSPVYLDSLRGHKIIQSACGDYCSYFLASSGELFACGSNDCGQLGLGHRNACFMPTSTNFKSVKSVSAAASHCVVLTQCGTVYVCGGNSFGQLGLGHNRNVAYFTCIPFPMGSIAKVSCGVHFIALLSNSKKVYTTYKDLLGQVGPTNLLRIVPLAYNVTEVACGAQHAIILAEDRSVWGFGGNNVGQLGNNTTIHHIDPVRCCLPSHVIVKSVWAGHYCSGLITQSGDIFRWGEGRFSGISGMPTNKLLMPKMISKSPDMHVLQVVFKAKYTILLCESKQKEQLSFLSQLEKTLMSSLQCPVCLKTMCSPIFQCTIGHSFCKFCYIRLISCPVCRDVFSGKRNYALEKIIDTVMVPCLHCSKLMLLPKLEEHVAHCNILVKI